MKNTKNLLIVGMILTTTLFASIEAFALGATRKVNPNLTANQKSYLEYRIKIVADYTQKCNSGIAFKKTECPAFERYLARLESVYYGNRGYTNEKFEQTMDQYGQELNTD